MTVDELIVKLKELPGDWYVYATKAGGSLEIWDPDGPRFAWVFTDDRATKHRTHRGRYWSSKQHQWIEDKQEVEA